MQRSILRHMEELEPFGNKSWSRHGLHWISFAMQMVMVCRTRMTFALANGYERGNVQFGSLAALRTSMAMDARTVWRTRIATTMAWRTEWIVSFLTKAVQLCVGFCQ